MEVEFKDFTDIDEAMYRIFGKTPAFQGVCQELPWLLEYFEISFYLHKKCCAQFYVTGILDEKMDTPIEMEAEQE